MRNFNRILYYVSAACLAVLVVLLIISIWGEIEHDVMWKFVGSFFIVLLACGVMLIINFLVLKIREKIGD